MFSTILNALAPIIVVVTMGWISGRYRILPKNAGEVLAGFVVKFALPLSLFIAASKATADQLLNVPYVLALAIGLLSSYCLGFALSIALFGRGKAEAAVQGLAASFPNMAYCGPPVLVAAVSHSALLAVVVGNLIVTIILIPLTLILLKGERLLKSIRIAIFQPLVLLPLAGAVMALSGLQLPELIISSVNEIGVAAGGCALFTLGLILSNIRFVVDLDVVINVGVKNIFQPVLFLGAGLALGLTGDLLKQVFLIGVLPTATAVPTLALANKTYAGEAASSVMASTLLAIITISVGVVLVGLL